MADRWYYEHDEKKSGPCSPRELKDLADTGQILPTDTIWKEGIDKGVSASKVKNLFSPDQAAAPTEMKTEARPEETAPEPAAATDTPAAEAQAEEAEAAPPEKEPVPKYQTTAKPDQPRKGRVVAGKGATVIGQDGITAKIRKKCLVCGQEDSSFATVKIKSGMNKVSFFCRKCKRRREAEFQGIMS